MDIEKILKIAEDEVTPVLMKYYQKESDLYKLLMTHSRLVAKKALECMERHSIIEDAKMVARSALLHDIGIVRCNAPGIYCIGEEPYIRHGIIGRRMLEECGLDIEAMVCERHTGSGITALEIEQAQMNLPIRDMVPETMLEKLVCYADKFYSKSGDVYRMKTSSQIRISLSRYGSASMERFDELEKLLG